MKELMKSESENRVENQAGWFVTFVTTTNPEPLLTRFPANPLCREELSDQHRTMRPHLLPQIVP